LDTDTILWKQRSDREPRSICPSTARRKVRRAKGRSEVLIG
jgi:hypothetical protein